MLLRSNLQGPAGHKHSAQEASKSRSWLEYMVLLARSDLFMIAWTRTCDSPRYKKKSQLDFGLKIKRKVFWQILLNRCTIWPWTWTEKDKNSFLIRFFKLYCIVDSKAMKVLTMSTKVQMFLITWSLNNIFHVYVALGVRVTKISSSVDVHTSQPNLSTCSPGFTSVQTTCTACTKKSKGINKHTL